MRTTTKSRRRSPRPLRVVITAGPTREYLDSVRFISNPSSGKMGYAIAAAAAEAGHRVTLITGPVELPPPRGVHIIRVETAAEMLRATMRAFRQADAAVFAAAVCDYRPRRRAAHKLPKKQSAHTLELVPTADIAAACGRIKGRRITIAFALEDHDGHRHAEQKLRRKNCDAIVLNEPSAIGSEVISSEYLISRQFWERPGRSSKGNVPLHRSPGQPAWECWGELSKAAVAKRLIQVIGDLVARGGGVMDRVAADPR